MIWQAVTKYLAEEADTVGTYWCVTRGFDALSVTADVATHLKGQKTFF